MTERTTQEISRMFREGHAIDHALVEAYRDTVLRHRRLGIPLVVWPDGRVVAVSAEDVPLPEVAVAK